MKKSRAIGLKGLEAETPRVCNAVSRWLGEFHRFTRLTRTPPRGWPDLIASRIPPGPGGSIARNNDNVQFWGPLEGPLDASGVPLGGLREASGGVWEASGGRLGGSWGHLGRQGAQEALKNSQGRPQTSPKTTPRDPKWLPKASQKRPQRPPRGPKRPLKH